MSMATAHPRPAGPPPAADLAAWLRGHPHPASAAAGQLAGGPVRTTITRSEHRTATYGEYRRFSCRPSSQVLDLDGLFLRDSCPAVIARTRLILLTGLLTGAEAERLGRGEPLGVILPHLTRRCREAAVTGNGGVASSAVLEHHGTVIGSSAEWWNPRFLAGLGRHQAG